MTPYVYHPLRWKFLRDNDDYRDLWGDDGRPTPDEVAAAGGQQAFAKLDEREEVLFNRVQDYEQAGRHIYHLDPMLVRMFRETSVADVPMFGLTTPFPSIYVYFGPEAGIRSPHGHPIDGAYVEISDSIGITGREERVLWIVLTPVAQDLDAMRRLPIVERLRADDGYRTIVLSSEDRDRTVGEAHESLFLTLGEHIARKSEFEHYRAQKTMLELGMIERMQTYEEAKANPSIDDEDALWKGYDGEAVNLVVNALCFLTARADDVVRRWQDGTPAEGLDKIEQAKTPKRIRKAISELEALGYRKVWVCGSETARRVRTTAAGDGVECHWRRGHWRNQAHGPRRSERKLIWIEPTVVGGEGAEPKGTIHKL